MGRADHWRWFCGANITTLENFTWTTDNVIQNLCVIDEISSAFQIVSFCIFLSTFLVLKFCSHYRHINTPYLIRYPGHFLRWLMSVLLVILSIGTICEGVLTSLTFKESDFQPNNLPHLYIAPIFDVLCVGVSLFLYQWMEIWRLSKLSWLLLVYWLGSVAMETGHILGLKEMDEAGVDVVRYDLVVCRLTFLCVLATIEINVIRIKIFRFCHDPLSDVFPKDLKSPSMRYYHEYSNSFSSGVFHWLHPVLQTGAGRPLEITDLGILPYKHSARGSYEELKKSFLEEKDRASYLGKNPSLWTVCRKVSGIKLSFAILLKLVAASLGYVSPMVIGGITDYAYTIGKEKEPSDPHFVSLQEYFNNGYILLVVAFLSITARGIIRAYSTYIQQIEGVKLRTGLQTLVYEKSLRLSMFLTSGGTMSIGQITNHMSIDSKQGKKVATISINLVTIPLNTLVYEKALRLSMFLTTGGTMTMGQITNHMSIDSNQGFQVAMSCTNIFIVPFNLIVSMVLLYYEMGSASLVGAAVIVLLFPFQIMVASRVVKYQKRMLKLSDQRLKQSNELLQGMKLLKLYGWEELYEQAIEAVRHKELKCLAGMLSCIAITMAFTTIAPIGMTLVGFILYPSLSGNRLTPGVAFTSVILFNSLGNPLLQLPFTLSAVVNALGFILYPTLSGNRLTPGVAFTSVTLFNSLGNPLLQMPFTLSAVANALVSFKRLSVFFMASEVHEEEGSRNWEEPDIDEEEEDYLENKSPLEAAAVRSDGYTLLIDDTHGKKKSTNKSSLLSTSGQGSSYGALDTGSLTSSLIEKGVQMERPLNSLPDSVAIEIIDGIFTWDGDSTDPILSDINVQIPAGKLTIIVGQVGSGKSSLLSAMMGEMVTVYGHVQFNSAKRSVAYAAQKAWLCNASLRDNILFGQEMDEQRYNQVISACALGPDIEILPAGDMTEIGEKGINLSGGQKQRVSVARAMYANRDIVVLDDPLSALDVHVGGHLFQEGIVGMLLKEKQTVVLVTHQLQYLESADKVLVLKDGSISAEGTQDEVTTEDVELYYSWRHALHKASESESAREATCSGRESSQSQSEAEREELRRRVRKRIVGSQVSEEKGDAGKTKGKLIEDEEMERGSISYQVYLFYLQSIGTLPVILVVLVSMCGTALQAYGGFFFAEWSDAGLQTGNNTKPTSYYIKYFAVINFGNMALTLSTLSLVVHGIYTAAKNLHFAMIRNIIRVPLRFFETTPIGRILNRMSADTSQIDMGLFSTMYVLLVGIFNCVSSIVVNTIISVGFIILVIPMVIIYFFIQSYYLKSTRELQRISSVTASPVFAYFSETLAGLETIRAYKDQKRFFRTFLGRVDTNLIPFMYQRTIGAWLAARLEFLGAFIVIFAGGSALVGASSGKVSSSLVGLSLSLSIGVAGLLAYLVQSASQVEVRMNAVERVKHYIGLENEDYEGRMPRWTWPRYGEIWLEGVSARYAKSLDPVLKNITVNIKSGEKVGICGRTGSGKSSLTLSLFRIIDMFEGRITIDDVDIASVPLTALRQKLSIIPQDPVLFTGSIRYNLDPEGHRSDDVLWEAIEIAQLKDVVQALDEGLEYMVTEGGENFSMGQRQLFCLARAFLRKSRILIMDEATASIDMQTDKILQKVVATAFADRTVLTIAHRVTTILNCDTILVLSEGEIVEHDSPENLLAREGSIFADFVKSKK